MGRALGDVLPEDVVQHLSVHNVLCPDRRGRPPEIEKFGSASNDVSALLHLFEDSVTIPGGGGAVFFEASMVFLPLFAVLFPPGKKGGRHLVVKIEPSY